MSSPLGTRPPLPPEPPEPPFPRPTPGLPELRPAAPGPVSANATLMVGARDWLDERLLDQRVIALAGELDDEAVNRTVAALALLDADGDEPIQLRLSGVSAVVTSVLPIIDALDLTGAPIHATALGTLTGPAIALLAVADRRTAGPHALFQLREPRARGEHGRDVERLAAAHAREVALVEERLATACGRPVEEIAADMRAGRLLTAQEARDYGLVDDSAPTRRAVRS
jgi:ATP-dependent Clp protease, protease subunit